MSALISASHEYSARRELVLGCGRSRRRLVSLPGEWEEFANPTTIDINLAHYPDILHDLNNVPWPAESGVFDEVAAYDVLEHLGRQGDAASFFGTFGEIWRVLKPAGRLYAVVPAWDSIWALGEPGHTRVINEGTLTFLDQGEYEKQVGKTAMSDYRDLWRGDFAVVERATVSGRFSFVLQKVCPSRWKESI